jgi:hypothetical protein
MQNDKKTLHLQENTNHRQSLLKRPLGGEADRSPPDKDDRITRYDHAFLHVSVLDMCAGFGMEAQRR